MGRNSTLIFWLFGFPALAAIGLGMSLRDDQDQGTRVGVLAVNEASAAPFVRTLEDARIHAQAIAPDQVARALAAGSIGLLVIPPATAGAPIVYRYETGRATARMQRELIDAALQRAFGRHDPAPTRDEPLPGSGTRYIDFLVPGLIGLNVLSGSWSIAWALVSMRMRRILRLLQSMPVRGSEILLALQLARTVFLPFEVLLLVALAHFLFDFRVAGSWLSILVVVGVSSVCFTGLAVLAASRSRQFEVASGILNLISIPMVFLSGVFFSTARFPGWLKEIVAFLPLAALLEALRSLMLRGASLASVTPQLAILLVWGVPTFLIGAIVMRWES